MLSGVGDCDQYWSQEPLNTGFAEAAVWGDILFVWDERIRISALAEDALPFLMP